MDLSKIIGAVYFLFVLSLRIIVASGNETSCNVRLVESIPIGMELTNITSSMNGTFDAWKWLLREARESVNIASFYWTLRGDDIYDHPSANLGEEIFQELWNISMKDTVSVRIAQNAPTDMNPNLDTVLLGKHTKAKVVSLDFDSLLGGGVLHTKLWTVDDRHFYIGSANMDWRSLTQVKELGIFGRNCPQLVADVNKIFEAYWYLGSSEGRAVPAKWPAEFETKYNKTSPMRISFNGQHTMDSYFSSSPPQFLPKGRTSDLDAILSTIESAKEFVYIAVMDYAPLIMFGRREYWPNIDTALRSAAIDRLVNVKLLISLWNHTNPSIGYHLKSLHDLTSSFNGVNIEIRYFSVPADSDQAAIPYARVNHNKYMVTDNTAYIGTSNWEGDYFIDTAGVALLLKEKNQSAGSPREQLHDIFIRDWNSPYAFSPFTKKSLRLSDLGALSLIPLLLCLMNSVILCAIVFRKKPPRYDVLENGTNSSTLVTTKCKDSQLCFLGKVFEISYFNGLKLQP